MQPSDYKLPHAEFRPYQEESIVWANNWQGLNNGTIKVTEQSTGSGKSSIAMAQSIQANGQVVVLTKSKNLQQQYGGVFHDCAILFGRSNYPCIHYAAPENATAVDCLYPDDRGQCEYYSDCHYVLAKNRAHMFRRVTLNYAYWLTT